MKKKMSIYNFISGFLGQIITIVIGLFIPRLVLVSFGSEGNGLVSSISQIFVYISLLEAGVGAASTQALYGPIEKDDKENINRILSATHKYYNKTGIVYLLATFLLSICYPLLVNVSMDYLDVMLIIFFIGFGGVINYLLVGKFKIFLAALGKNYVVINIATMITILSNVIRIILILLRYDLVVLQFFYMIINVLQALFIIYYMKKNYQWINLDVKPDYNAISKKNFALIHQIANVIFSNTDVLVITIFCGLKVVSVYTIFNMIFSMAQTILSTLNNSTVFVIGQKYHGDKKDFRILYDFYEYCYIIFSFLLMVIVLFNIIPFMHIYTSGISDANYYDYYLAILFFMSNLLSSIRIPGINLINIDGKFKETARSSIIESIINLSFSILLTYKIGVYGTLIGTIIALLYRNIDIIYFCNRNILKNTAKKTISCIISCLFSLTVCIFLYDFFFKSSEVTIFLFLKNLICSGIVYCLVFLLTIIFNKTTIITFVRRYLIND